MSNTWLVDRIEYIKGLKNPSIAQKTLLEIYLIPEADRTPTNNKHLSALIKAEKAADKAAVAQRAAKKILTEEQEKKRKERTHKLVKLGALFEIAELDNRNPAELLGLLLSAPRSDQDWENLKNHGELVLSSRKK